MGDKRTVIAVMMRDINSEFAEVMYSGFYDGARQAGVELVYLLGPQTPGEDSDASLEEDVDDYYLNQLDAVYDYAGILKPDAMILVSGSLRRSLILPDINALVERFKEIPTLVLETIPGKPSIPYQVADSYGAMCECVEHLIVDHGYSFIVYVSGDTGEYDFKERLRAFRDTMNAHSLNYDRSQIVVCDQSESDERKINGIFDDFPYVDAIVCSCDTYARIAYRACNKRGIEVGKDVAITGFDDLGMSHEMTPSLTGVMYDSYAFGMTALNRAVAIARGQKTGGVKIPCRFMKRCSCGCSGIENKDRYQGGAGKVDKAVVEKLKRFMANNVGRTVDEIYSYLPYEAEKIEFKNFYQEMFEYIFEAAFSDSEDQAADLDKIGFYVDKLSKYGSVSARMITGRTVYILENLISMMPYGRERSRMTVMMLETLKQLKEAEIVRMRETGSIRRRQLWFLPLFTRDLFDTGKSEAEVLSTILKRLRGMDIASAHIFMYHRPVIYRRGVLPPPPDKLHYAGTYDRNGVQVFLRQNSIVIDKDNGISSVLPEENAANYSAFVICSGDRQYGIILYEVDKNAVFFAMLCTLQIGALFNFRDISYIADEKTEELKQKEDILGYVSDRDDLTSVLNGRGFIERLIKLVSDNNGRQAYLLFADVSHLGEINLGYGHESGDEALMASAREIARVLGDENPLGRIGDDEFISVIFTDTYDMIDSIRKSVQRGLEEFNLDSDMPYNIDISMDAYPFVCEKNMDISDLIKKAGAAIGEKLKPENGFRIKNR